MKRVLVALLPLALACASATPGAPAQTDAGPPDANAKEICRDLGDRIATEIQRKCNQDKQKNYDDFVAQAQCDNVTNIADAGALEQCFDLLADGGVTCAELRGGAIPPPCRGQLIRPR